MDIHHLGHSVFPFFDKHRKRIKISRAKSQSSFQGPISLGAGNHYRSKLFLFPASGRLQNRCKYNHLLTTQLHGFQIKGYIQIQLPSLPDYMMLSKNDMTLISILPLNTHAIKDKTQYQKIKPFHIFHFKKIQLSE